MTTLYLRRVEISNVRAYGDNFSLSLPGPGVTILTGPDGLGKSTFFESIEWALTGRVRQRDALTQAEPDQGSAHGLLARRAENGPVAQYGVSLEFVNEAGESRRIERRAVREQESHERFAEVSSSTQQQLIDLLRADSWGEEVRDLGDQLRLTHVSGPAGTADRELIGRWQEVLSRRAQLAQPAAAGGGLPAEVITEKARAIAAALKTALEVEFALEGTPPPDVLLARLLQTLEKAEAALLEKKRVLSEAEAELNARLQLNSESKRDLLLQLSAERQKVAQTTKEKSLLVGENDRHTHELWMIQSFARDIAKKIQRVTALDNQIRDLLLKKQEIPAHLEELSRSTELELESAQSARGQLPDLESLNQSQTGMQERLQQLSSAIKENHQVVDQLEKEILVAKALLQQHADLLSEFDQRNKLAEQESKLQELREQHQRLADAWLAWQREEELRQLPAVSWLLRLSTAYPWSRWPALLLDEPLQQHDGVQPAAFIESLRNLVRDRKYQVILSTRDEGLAEDLRRQMVESGIECVTCRYTGLSPTGVLSSTV